MAIVVVEFLLQNLSRLLEDEFTLLSGVEEKIKSLCNELKFIDIFLKRSEGKCNDEVLKEVERFIVLHKFNAEIESIRSRIEEIYENRERYGIREGEFQSDEAAAAESLRRRRRDVEEEDVQLIMESDSRRKVIPIIGMGVLGKTTLARKIYNNNQKTSDGGEELGEEELKKKVAEGLKGKKYLVVLDDIWKTKVWDEVKSAFPDDRTGSRILITSREKEVATM
ncbi:unnamed protein product [Sphenostylis stenocarpa]|uniref:Uncharacterized protein n=1 Tax=Sphenostylis stenocarpa TaxID=92480 RepID=A0AA86V5Y7_9FABA|nr:unnamed protein product [Sphenostylis stenocarpa]